MDLTRCPKCGKRMVPVVTFSGRTDLQCISCDDPAVKWAESPLIAPEKPIIVEPLSQPASAEATSVSFSGAGRYGVPEPNPHQRHS